MHWCANVVCGQSGVDLARLRRGESVPAKDLARGPARLAQSLGLDGTANGLDLLDPSSPVNLEIGDEQAFLAGPRIGLSKEAERPWRFWIPGEPTVSGNGRIS